MLAHMEHIGYLHLGKCASDILLNLSPELTGIRLGFGIRSPVISNTFIFTSNLTVMAAIAFGDIYYKYLTHINYLLLYGVRYQTSTRMFYRMDG